MTIRPNRRQFMALAGAAALSLRAGSAHAIADSPATTVVWSGEGEFFGGFSGIEVSADRSSALVISDRGFAVRTRLIRDANETLTGIEALEHFPLLGRRGQPVRGGRGDTEGLDEGPDGTLHVSFEGQRRSRVARYADPRGRARELVQRRDWRELPGNRGLEALALDPDGIVYTIPEEMSDGSFPLYWLDDNRWRIAAQLAGGDDFAPVGMDFGPDGHLYLLERKFRLAFFGTRISRLRQGNLGQREILVETSYGALDNHEGISITRDGSGQLWATTISDDNQNRFQRTEICEFPLPSA